MAECCSVWHQRDAPCSFDGRRDPALMSGTIAGYSPGDDLAPLRGKKPESARILVINGKAAVRTKPAHFSPAERPPALLKPRHL